MSTVKVDLGRRAYPIYIGPSARDVLRGGNTPLSDAQQVVVIADQTVADLHLATLVAELPPGAITMAFPPGETSKSLTTAERLFRQLAGARVERGAMIVTFGGGVAGDLGGFVAATWLRGVGYVQVPTTLLAAVDASVGGKTGVNLPAGKNLVGAFHQPRAVVIDTDFLQTLSERDFTSGLAESVKHAAIRDPTFLAWHEANAHAVRARAAEAVADMIARDCEIKSDIVRQDEREAGLRAILNHGHTIGHAIEHLLGYDLRHGECVALGMIVENELARRRGMLPREQAERVRGCLCGLGLPARLPREVAAEDVVAACRQDKKVVGGEVNFMLLSGIGAVERAADITPSEIASALEAIAPGP